MVVAFGCRYHFDPLADSIEDSPLSPVGCADGTREAFVDLATFPTIAGCSTQWTGSLDLRTSRTGTGCGNDLGICSAPEDGCAPGWQLCGRLGDPTDLTARLTAAQCTNAVGAFIAGLQHCSPPMPGGCMYLPPYPCLASDVACTEPVCCGTLCGRNNSCKDGIFPAATAIAGNFLNGPGNSCGDLTSSSITGVMCCL
jgi:hypothetical protein